MKLSNICCVSTWMGDRLSIDLLLHVVGLCMSLALGYSTFRLRPACLRLIHLVQFNYLIDWNDIFFGQKGLKNFKQYGTPYSALLATSAQYTRRYDVYKALCFVHNFKVIGSPILEKEPITNFVFIK